MNKWLNRQKPITLGFIVAIFTFIFGIIINSAIDENLLNLKVPLALATFMFFMSWLLFSMGEKSSIIFNEIESLYFRAKKVKTKEELTVIETDYKILREKCQHQNHYSQINIIREIIELKKEFL